MFYSNKKSKYNHLILISKKQKSIVFHTHIYRHAYCPLNT